MILGGYTANIPVEGDFDENNGTRLIEKYVLWRGADCFLASANCLMDTARPVSLSVANPSPLPRTVRKGEVLGFMHDPAKRLSKESDLTKADKLQYDKKVLLIRALVEGSLNKQDLNHAEMKDNESDKGNSSKPAEDSEEPEDWGPKTAEPGDAERLRAEDLEKLIDVDPTLPKEQCDAAYALLKKHELVFGFDGRLGKHPTKVHIELEPGMKPISSAPYIASPAKRDLIDKQLDLWLEQGVIEPSASPWGAPVIIVHRNGKDRLCVDWRKLNAATVPDQFPIPWQTDILQALSGAQYLSSFDALAGFTQLEFNKVSQPYTAMRTHRGLHQFTRMPFGWRNGPPIFQRVMQEILAPYLWMFTLVYIDDIVVYSNSFEEHLEHVDAVLSTIEKAGITLAPHKCHVGYRSIQLLGQKVS